MANPHEFESEQQEVEDSPIVVDHYGVKASFRPAGAAESPPKTFKELGDRLKRALLRLVIAPVEFIPTVFECASSLLHGLGRLPGNFADRIQQAHKKFDAIEAEKIAKLTQATAGPAVPNALSLLQDRLQQLQNQGLHVEIRKLDDGRIGLIFVGPNVADHIDEVLRLAAPDESKSEVDD